MSDREENFGQAIPEWFWPAVETPSEENSVEVLDCAVHYRCWGDKNKPGLLFAHGMNAHSRWWDFIAPHLLDDYYVVAPDFTGMGDSDYRYDYTPAIFVDEIIAVMDASGIAGGVLVGHSFGGFIGIRAASRHTDKISAFVMVDAAVRPPHRQADLESRNLMGTGATLFPDAQSAYSRFRLQPPQPCDNQYLLEYIARRSVMRVDDGWTWKFDEDLRASLSEARQSSPDEQADYFRAIQCPIGLIYGAASFLFEDKETLPYMQSLRNKPFPVVEIAHARHHVFVDQPLGFVQALRDMLGRLT